MGEKTLIFFSRLRVCLGLGLLPSVLGGCAEFTYYGQAVRGQLEVMRRSRPIHEVLVEKQPGLTPEVAEALRRLPAILCFAEQEMSLPAGGSYRTYADLGRACVVWNVFAAGEFDLEPKSWWYPVVGRLRYRGYFSADDARSCAEKLERRGFDVVVAGVRAYSTLGWFGDPVLNTFVTLDTPELVALICHELAHRRLFFRGDTVMSEAFATVVEEEALERWLAREQSAGLQPCRTLRRREVLERIGEEFEATRGELARLYSTRNQLDEAVLRARKAEVFKALELRCRGLVSPLSPGAARRFAQLPFNNARLAIDDSYRRLVPALRAILEHECGGNLQRFYLEMEEIARGRRPRPEKGAPVAAISGAGRP